MRAVGTGFSGHPDMIFIDMNLGKSHTVLLFHHLCIRVNNLLTSIGVLKCSSHIRDYTGKLPSIVTLEQVSTIIRPIEVLVWTFSSTMKVIFIGLKQSSYSGIKEKSLLC